MAFFPKIQSPCPYKSRVASVMDGDMCRLCNRQVFDLTGWSDGERVAFLAGCSEEVCVSYRLPLAAAAALAAIAIPTAAAAQDQAIAPDPAVQSAVADLGGDDIYIEMGGIKDPANAEFIEVADDMTIPELPVAYEDEPGAAPAPAPVTAPSGS